MHNNLTTQIYVHLLDEGTTTLRPTTAIDKGNGLYEILPTEDYDPEDEAWEFLPGTIVKLVETILSEEEKILVASDQNPNVVRINMPLVGENLPMFKDTSALSIGSGLYKVLSTPHYSSATEHWKFIPGSIVKLESLTLPGGNFLVPVEKVE